MRKLLLAFSVAAAALLPLLAQPALSQSGAPQTVSAARKAGPPTGPVPRLPNGMVNFGDVVWLSRGSGALEQAGLTNAVLDALMQPWAKELVKTRDETQDPHNYCMPDVVPRMAPFPIRFVQNYTHAAPTHMFILNEGNIHSFRQIFMDGRKHPEDIAPTWYGHSIGWWEKDTLVVDTVGFNDKAWFDGRGHPHTEQLHTVERYTRIDLGHMENKVTIDDPGAYIKPFSVTLPLTTTLNDELLEYICQENNQYGSGNSTGK